MAFKPSLLYTAPTVNPINKKARSLPLLNVVNIYGRVFFFSWFGFFVAFWSWYAFPPLLKQIIAKNLDMTDAQVANSNIIGLMATLLVRLVAGTCCDRFGPRYTFVGCLLIGAIPTFLAGTAHSVSELYALRFFIGILGGSFVPCQVWTTAFFDTNIVGTANAFAAGFGNSGGGVTYFIMPAVFNSLVYNQGLAPDTAWRVAFVVPGIVIVFLASCILLLCPDTPTGKWSQRKQVVAENIQQIEGVHPSDEPATTTTEGSDAESPAQPTGSDQEKRDMEKLAETDAASQQQVDLSQGQAVVESPTLRQTLRGMFSPQSIATGACYFCTFGSELAVNIILGNYYSKNFPFLTLQQVGNWAAMFGLMNAWVRPAGGIVADAVYKYTGTVWSKKALLHFYSIAAGIFLIAIGASDPHHLHALTLTIGIGLSFFIGGANGINYAIVPHVYPKANGVVSGFTGACGNLGGVVFAIIFRYNGTDYPKAMYIIGAIVIAINVLVSWIRPVPRS